MEKHTYGTKEGVFNSLDSAIRKVDGIKHVDWQKETPNTLDPKKWPGVFINNLRHDRHADEDEPDIENVLTICLLGFIRAEEGENLGTILNTFIDKVEKAVLADKTQNGNATNTEVEVIVTDCGALHPKAEFIMALVVWFWTKD